MWKLLLFFLGLAVAGLLWFLFIKKYDYRFTMDAKYSPGTVFYEVREWKSLNFDDNNNIRLIESKPFYNLTQKISSSGGNAVEFYWELEEKNDTVTRVAINIRSEQNSLFNRLNIVNPFIKSVYIDSLKKHILNFGHNLKNEQKAYRIQVSDTLVNSPALNCICHSSQNIPVTRKALEMVGTIDILEDYMLDQNLKLTGNPFVKINKWDREEDIINFEFCFPVNLSKDIRPSGKINFRQIPSSTSLKAIFNGNYRLSHKAWFELLYIAEERNLKTNMLPLEVFFNNPNIESNPSPTWKAEIYLPILQ